MDCISDDNTIVTSTEMNCLPTRSEVTLGEEKPKKHLIDWQVTFMRVCILTRVFRGVKFLSGDIMESRTGRKIVDMIFETTSLDEVGDRMDYVPEIESRVKFILSQRRSTVVKSIREVVKSCKYIFKLRTSATYGVLTSRFCLDVGEWKVQDMIKFRAGPYAEAEEETKQAWQVYVKNMVPCLTVEYRKALKKRGDDGLLSKVASVSDEAFIFWACVVYEKRWKSGMVGKKTMEEEEEHDEEEEEENHKDEESEEYDDEETDYNDDEEERMGEKNGRKKRRTKQQVRNQEKDLFPEVFQIVQERRNSEWSQEWERKAQELIQYELETKTKKRDGQEVQREKKKLRAEFPCDEIY
jgi:flagellar biosynthesis GTPase FlhF